MVLSQIICIFARKYRFFVVSDACHGKIPWVQGAGMTFVGKNNNDNSSYLENVETWEISYSKLYNDNCGRLRL